MFAVQHEDQLCLDRGSSFIEQLVFFVLLHAFALGWLPLACDRSYTLSVDDLEMQRIDALRVLVTSSENRHDRLTGGRETMSARHDVRVGEISP